MELQYQLALEENIKTHTFNWKTMKNYTKKDLRVVKYKVPYDNKWRFIIYTDRVVPDESDEVDEYSTRVYPDVIEEEERAVERVLDILNGKLPIYRLPPWQIKNKPSKIKLLYKFGT